MADVSIKYKGAVKAEMNASGTKTVKTAGKYCEGDIEVIYTDPEKPTQSKTVTPTAAGFTVNPDSGKVLSSVVINGDSDLKASNVRKNVNIFGVTGTLEEGITPTGSKTITENGTHDVTNFASAIVNVPSSPIKTGTFTASSSDWAQTIEVGMQPTEYDHIMICRLNTDFASASHPTTQLLGIYLADFSLNTVNWTRIGGQTSAWTSGSNGATDYAPNQITRNGTSVIMSGYASGPKFESGVTYRWFAWKES